MFAGSSEATPGRPAPAHLEREAGPGLSRVELPEAATELLAIVGHVTAVDGPLQSSPDPANRLSPWHERALWKAMERLEVIDAHLRGRVAFLAAAEDRGYGSFDAELELAGAALDTCRATTLVVEALLERVLPSTGEFDSMADATLRIFPALEAI